MIIKDNLILEQAKKRPIIYDLYYNPSPKALPLVIFCHGYKGFKDWGAWDIVAKTFAEAGFCFLKFNFSHNGGTIEQPIDFPDLKAFAENNFSLELDDLDRLLNAVEADLINNDQKISTISLIGHSRGGGTVIIKAAEDSRIDKVVTWASVSDFQARFQEGTPQFEKWKETGVTYIENTRTKQQLPHYFQFYEDYKQNEERFNIFKSASRLNIPQLIIHGSNDETVSIKEASAIHRANPNSMLEFIPGSDHVFGAVHPWKDTTMPADLKKVTDITIDFLKQ